MKSYFKMTRASLTVILILSMTGTVWSQKFNNEQLLNSYGIKHVERLLKNSTDSIGFWKADKLGNYQFFLIPTAEYKNIEEYDFAKSISQFINFDKLDTLSEVLIIKNDKVDGMLKKNESGYYFLHPLLNTNRKFKSIKKKIQLKDALIFKLPFFEYEWWIKTNECLCVLSKHKLMNADEYIRTNFDENFIRSLLSQ